MPRAVSDTAPEGATKPAAVAASLKRCPDTNLAFVQPEQEGLLMKRIDGTVGCDE
jgi:hypothetical protein